MDVSSTLTVPPALPTGAVAPHFGASLQAKTFEVQPLHRGTAHDVGRQTQTGSKRGKFARRVGLATPPTETQEGRETVAIRLPAFISPTSVADQRPLANCGSDATADAPNTRHEAITQSAMR
jgi:hypothetical protein